jgi:putative tryptophan/tyrosine transport system substrate-binding protein
MFLDEAPRIVQLAARARRPAIYPDRAFVEAGGLMSYGTDAQVAMKLAGEYVARILAGEKPADMPVREVPPFALHVNRATARAQGIKLPTV